MGECDVSVPALVEIKLLPDLLQINSSLIPVQPNTDLDHLLLFGTASGWTIIFRALEKIHTAQMAPLSKLNLLSSPQGSEWKKLLEKATSDFIFYTFHTTLSLNHRSQLPVGFCFILILYSGDNWTPRRWVTPLRFSSLLAPDFITLSLVNQ